MFIPLDRKPDWRNPPVITLLLILANLLAFTLWQGQDDRFEQQAYSYYLDSDLPGIELPLYREFLLQQGHSVPADHDRYLLSSMLTDGAFQQQLKSGQIITLQHPEHANWQAQRSEFERRLYNIVSYRYSFKTAEPSLTTLFSHMFLHAGWGHLIGNMVFLLLIGFSLELALQRPVYLAAYLLTGISSALFYLWLEPGSLKWGVGASGAIAGLMGLFTVVFGRRKIRFFYTLLFYFDFVRAPAIILLPIWLGYELYSQLTSQDNINYLAHIGGLLSGALLGLLIVRFGTVDIGYLDEEEKAQQFKLRYQQGLDHIARLEADKARRVFRELDEDYPGRLEVLEQLFNLSKLNPQDPALHDYAQRLLTRQGEQTLGIRQLHDIFIGYVERVQPNVRLSAEQLISLALRFAAGGYIEDAEKIVLYLTTRKSDFARNAEGLMALATHYKRSNNPAKAEKYLKILLECYPESSEARHARQALGTPDRTLPDART